MTGKHIQRLAAALVGAIGAASGAFAQSVPPTPGPVVELRQYKIVHGRRDAFVTLFERAFVETQDAVGMPLIGQFRDLNDPDRFVWMRSFRNMPDRARALTDFYTGPVWLAYRAIANPMLDDNDNVLLLRPARGDSGLAAPARRPLQGGNPPPASTVVVNILYLWKDPGEGFTTFFLNTIAPFLRAGGLQVLGAYVTETTPNNFPRLPVRQSEKVFVWFTRTASSAQYHQAMRQIEKRENWKSRIVPALADYEERSTQTLFLSPTTRSAFR